MVLTLIMIMSTLHASEPWTCSDVPNLWDEASTISQERELNPETLSRFRQLIQSCQGQIPSNYTLARLETMAQRSQRQEYRNRLAEFTMGFRTDISEIRASGQRAGIPSAIINASLNFRPPRKSCQNSDYRNRLPPIRNQGSLGWCFGHTAADLASFRLGQPVSAMDSSIMGHLRRLEERSQFMSVRLGLLSVPQSVVESTGSFSSGYYTDETLNAMIQSGVCLSTQFQENDISFTNQQRELRVVIARAHAMAAAATQSGNSCTGLCESTLTESIRQAAPQLTTSQIRELIQNSSVPLRDFLLNLDQQACQQRTPLTGSVENIRSESVETLYDTISGQLSNGNIVGITYNSNVLTGGSVDPRNGHASSVVGQRWNEQTQRCELLLRNSWGSDCPSSRRILTCESDGHIWIPAYDLLNAASGATYLH